MTLVTTLVVGLAVFAGGVLLASNHGGGGGGTGEIFLEPAAAVGTRPPFTPSVAASPVTTSTITSTTKPPATTTTPAVTAPPTQTVATTSGTTPGLYGGTQNQHSCDPEQMISYLTANPAKGQAWAGVEGIRFSDLATYIRSLTPVLLRQDTRVTNHGFVNGRATSLQSVLQAGTAVLVDNQGVPRARCACGNPLLPPVAAAKPPSYTGTAWSGFTPTKVIAVVPAAPVKTLVLVDTRTGVAFTRPVGTIGTADAPYTGAAPTTTTVPSSPTSGAPSGRIPTVAEIQGSYTVRVGAAQGDCSGISPNQEPQQLTVSVSNTTVTLTSPGSSPLDMALDTANATFSVTQTLGSTTFKVSGDFRRPAGAPVQMTGVVQVDSCSFPFSGAKSG